MRRVIIESPYAGDIERNTAYARAAMFDCLLRGEAPFASHLLYTQVLIDADPEQRAFGIWAGLEWGRLADRTVVYQDYGITEGMSQGIARASLENRPVEYRNIGKQPFASGGVIDKDAPVPDIKGDDWQTFPIKLDGLPEGHAHISAPKVEFHTKPSGDLPEKIGRHVRAMVAEQMGINRRAMSPRAFDPDNHPMQQLAAEFLRGAEGNELERRDSELAGIRQSLGVGRMSEIPPERFEEAREMLRNAGMDREVQACIEHRSDRCPLCLTKDKMKVCARHNCMRK